MDDTVLNYNSQAHQDEFVLKILNYKKNGYFLEIGSCHPILVSNSYILENGYNWDGLMVELEQQH